MIWSCDIGRMGIGYVRHSAKVVEMGRGNLMGQFQLLFALKRFTEFDRIFRDRYANNSSTIINTQTPVYLRRHFLASDPRSHEDRP